MIICESNLLKYFILITVLSASGVAHASPIEGFNRKHFIIKSGVYWSSVIEQEDEYYQFTGEFDVDLYLVNGATSLIGFSNFTTSPSVPSLPSVPLTPLDNGTDFHYPSEDYPYESVYGRITGPFIHINWIQAFSTSLSRFSIYATTKVVPIPSSFWLIAPVLGFCAALIRKTR